MERSTTQGSTITDRQLYRGRTRGHSAGHEQGTRRKRSRRWGSSVWLLLLLALPAAPAGAVKIERMSPPPLDLEVTLPGYSPSISGDGRYVAFVVSDVRDEIWVRDRQSGATERVAEGTSPAISADGRFIAFTNDGIFVRDRQTGKMELVSVSTSGEQADGYSSAPVISGDGRFVAFASMADNLVPGDTNNAWDIFVRDRQTGKTELVSVAANGAPADGDSGYLSHGGGGVTVSPAISGDGRFVAFASLASNLVPGDTNGAGDIFVRDRHTGKTELVSVSPSGASANGGTALPPSISADGRFVAFASWADGLVPGDTNEYVDVFVRDRQTGKTELVSVAGVAAAGGYSPVISADGRFVVFASDAENFVPGDTNGAADIFVRDRQTGKTELVSVAANGGPAHGGSAPSFWQTPSISADGRFVVFQSEATNLVPGDTNGQSDVFVRDRATGSTELLAASVNVGRTPLNSGQPAISADGRWVVFVTAGQLFERDRITGAAALVSATASGAPANSWSGSPSISADGRFVAFVSQATNLVPGVTNGGIFVRDRQNGKTERVADGYSQAISADGRFVAFVSWARNLVPGDTNGQYHIFVRDRQTGKTELVSVTTNGTPANDGSGSPAISVDGRFVVFVSRASNLVPGDTNGLEDVFVRDRQTGKTELVSVSTSGGPGNNPSYSASISGDGRFVAFGSSASNLVPGGTNGGIYVRDRQTGKTEFVSAGYSASISADGRFVAFTNGDLSVRDRQTGKTERLADGYSQSISADGRFVAFTSAADNLVPGDTNGRADVFVAERE